MATNKNLMRVQEEDRRIKGTEETASVRKTLANMMTENKKLKTLMANCRGDAKYDMLPLPQ